MYRLGITPHIFFHFLCFFSMRARVSSEACNYMYNSTGLTTTGCSHHLFFPRVLQIGTDGEAGAIHFSSCGISSGRVNFPCALRLVDFIIFYVANEDCSAFVTTFFTPIWTDSYLHIHACSRQTHRRGRRASAVGL